MKEVNKGILDNDMVISVENIQKMGEVIALTCIKTVIVRSGKDLHYLYKGLLRDMNRSKDDYSPFSNAYDIAQEAMLFLCQHIGEKLGDNEIRKGCYNQKCLLSLRRQLFAKTIYAPYSKHNKP